MTIDQRFHCHWKLIHSTKKKKKKKKKKSGLEKESGLVKKKKKKKKESGLFERVVWKKSVLRERERAKVKIIALNTNTIWNKILIGVGAWYSRGSVEVLRVKYIQHTVTVACLGACWASWLVHWHCFFPHSVTVGNKSKVPHCSIQPLHRKSSEALSGCNFETVQSLYWLVRSEFYRHDAHFCIFQVSLYLEEND